MKTYIQAEVSLETHRRFTTHPNHRDKTQREFTNEIIEKYLASPEAQIPRLNKQVSSLVARIEWLESRLRALETRESAQKLPTAS